MFKLGKVDLRESKLGPGNELNPRKIRVEPQGKGMRWESGLQKNIEWGPGKIKGWECPSIHNRIVSQMIWSKTHDGLINMMMVNRPQWITSMDDDKKNRTTMWK